METKNINLQGSRFTLFHCTFPCPGHSFLAYSLVYWLGPLIGKAEHFRNIQVFKVSSLNTYTMFFSRHESCALPVFGKHPSAVQQESTLLQEGTFPGAQRKNVRRLTDVKTALIWSLCEPSRNI